MIRARLRHAGPPVCRYSRHKPSSRRPSGVPMRLAWLLLSASLCCVTGCTSLRLRQRTVNQGSTLPELQYQQVLNNLAQIAVNPSALPWHVNLKEGTSQVTDSL